MSSNIPEYEPALMGYLINNQKIGEREIYATLLDLIDKRAIKIKLIKGFVSDNDAKYEFRKNINFNGKLNEYEEFLLYCFFL